MKIQSVPSLFRHLVAGLSLTVGLGSACLLSGAVLRADASMPMQSQFAQAQSAQSPVQALTTSLPDGVYLYGQSVEPDKMGKAYFIFEARRGKVLGAFYMPRSSFDCAYGNFQADKVALTVIDSYEKSANPYEIALEKTASVANNGDPALPQIGLEGFSRLTQVSVNDRRILNVCKANYPKVLQ